MTAIWRKFEGIPFRRIAQTSSNRSSNLATLATRARTAGLNARIVRTANRSTLYVHPSTYRARLAAKRAYNHQTPYGLERGALYATALRVALGRDLTPADEIMLRDPDSEIEVLRQADTIKERYDRSELDVLSADLSATIPHSDPVKHMIQTDDALKEQIDAVVASRVIQKLGNIAIDNYFIQDPSVTEPMRREFDNYSPDEFGTWGDILQHSPATNRYVLYNRDGEAVGTFSEDKVNRLTAEAEAAIEGDMRMEMSEDMSAIQTEIGDATVASAEAERKQFLDDLEPTADEEQSLLGRAHAMETAVAPPQDWDDVIPAGEWTPLPDAEGGRDTEELERSAVVAQAEADWENFSLVPANPAERALVDAGARIPRLFDDRPLSHVEVREFLAACGRGDATDWLCGGVAAIDYPNWQYSENVLGEVLEEFGLVDGDALIEAAKGISLDDAGEITERRAGKLYISKDELRAAAAEMARGDGAVDWEAWQQVALDPQGRVEEEEEAEAAAAAVVSGFGLPFTVGGMTPEEAEEERRRQTATSDPARLWVPEAGVPITFEIEGRTITTADLLLWYHDNEPELDIYDMLDWKQGAPSAKNRVLTKLAESANKAGADFRRIDAAWEAWMDRSDATGDLRQTMESVMDEEDTIHPGNLGEEGKIREYDQTIAYALLRLSMLPINHPDRRTIIDDVEELGYLFTQNPDYYDPSRRSPAEIALGLDPWPGDEFDPEDPTGADMDYFGPWGGAFSRIANSHPHNQNIGALAERTAQTFTQYERDIEFNEDEFKAEISDLARDWTEAMELERGTPVHVVNDEYAYLRRTSSVEDAAMRREEKWVGPRGRVPKRGVRAKKWAAEYIYARHLRGGSPPTTTEIIEQHESLGRFVTINQLGNYLAKDPRFQDLGLQVQTRPGISQPPETDRGKRNKRWGLTPPDKRHNQMEWPV